MALWLAAGAAFAQAPARQPTPEEMRQAGAAYDRAVAARASGDMNQAASLYETADRLAPSPQALGNAIRAHREAGGPQHAARAATLALQLQARYGDRQSLADYARSVLDELSPTLTRVRASCEGCTLTLDQRLAPFTEFFVEPGMHTLVAGWSENRVRSHAFTARPGGTETVSLTPPAAAAVEPGGGAVSNGNGGTSSGNNNGSSGNGSNGTNGDGAGNDGTGVVAPPPARGGIPVPATLAMVGVTAIAGGVLIWSGLDAVAGVPAYEMNPTPEALREGQGRELRTNVLIGVVSAVGAATGVMAVFTRWGGGRVEVAPGAAGNQAAGALPGLTLRGSF